MFQQETLDEAIGWLQFALGLALGVALAFVIYAGLKPRIEHAVLRQETLKAEAEAAKAREVAAAAPAKKAASAGPKTAAADNQPSRPAAPGGPAAPRPPGRPLLTTLTPSDPLAGAPRSAWPALLAGLVAAAALAAGGAAWRQYRRQPQAPGAITSPVLEALFTLGAHRAMLQQSLGLSPRQIKRFSSKARVQHSQLRALRPTAGRPGMPFPVDNQIKAFQMLLLIEENRRLAKRFPHASPGKFISHLQAAYASHQELRAARQEALEHAVIKAEKQKERPTTHFDPDLDPDAEEKFMRQLYEMNAGLLA